MTDQRECPGCGQEFPEGGAFQTHVRYCDEVVDDESEKEPLEERVEKLETQLDFVLDRLSDVGDLELRLEELRSEFDRFVEAFTDIKESEMLREFEEITGREFDSLQEATQYAKEQKQEERMERALERVVERRGAGAGQVPGGGSDRS